MGPHFLKELHCQRDTSDLRKDGVNSTARAEGGYAVGGGASLDLSTIHPVHDFCRRECLTAIEAARSRHLRQCISVGGAEPVEMLLVGEGQLSHWGLVRPNEARMSCGRKHRGRASARPADASRPAHK